MIYRSIAFVGSILLVSCGKDSNDTKTTPPVITEASFVGLWETPCSKDGDGDNVKLLLTISADKTVKETQQYFSDVTCATKTIAIEVNSTFALAGEVDAATRKVNFAITDVKVLYNTDLGAQSATAASLCGYTDWAKDVAKSCINKSIKGDGKIDYATSTSFYNIFKLDGNTLYAGDESKTEAQRATTLKMSYKKI